MAKKRYALYISRPLASKFDLVAQQRHGSKSAMLEEALRLSLEPQRVPGAEEVLVRRLDELHKVVGTVNRDVAIVTETLALFVRYFLTITPPLPQSEQEPARLLGRERFQVFVAQVGRRLATDHRLVSEVLETISSNSPDLFATTADDAPVRGQAAGNGNGAHREVAAAMEPTDSKKDTDHG
ncbi:MAG: CopG family transcriptional regulator [Hyphomicrobium sp.]|nr:CopG family transcriptional regulator [Hyphomicrobium sp.]MBN9263206.1 CopG family transcriptional regulator [Hyphomicrobium sp.]